MSVALENAPKLAPLRITNVETSEVVDLTALVTTDDAFHLALNVQTAIRALQAYQRWLESLIEARMDADGATQKVVQGVVYEFKAPAEWVVDDPETMIATLQTLIELGQITEAEYGEIVSYPPVFPKVNHTKLNGLLKRGAAVADAINAHRRQVFGNPKLTFKRMA